MKYTQKAAIRALNKTIADNERDRFKKVLFKPDGTYWYCNSWSMFVIREFLDPGYPIEQYTNEQWNVFQRVLERARREGVEQIEPLTPEILKEYKNNKMKSFRINDDYYASPELMLRCWAVLGPNMEMFIPKEPKKMLYLKSERGEAVLCPIKPPLKPYERDINS